MKQVMPLTFFLLLLMPGCVSRLTDWMADHAQQGNVRETPKARVTKYLRTIRIYQEFSTLGIFDALWLSPQVRQAYAQVHTEKYVLDAEREEEFLRRQRVENDNFISFYVLAYMSDTTAALGDKNSPWAIDLKVNNKLYAPKVIESIDFAPEYLMFLNRVITKQKSNYLVKFAAKDEDGNSLLTSKTRMLELRFSTADRSTSLVWYLDKNQNLAKHHE